MVVFGPFPSLVQVLHALLRVRADLRTLFGEQIVGVLLAHMRVQHTLNHAVAHIQIRGLLG